jgi:hypothetical protein
MSASRYTEGRLQYDRLCENFRIARSGHEKRGHGVLARLQILKGDTFADPGPVLLNGSRPSSAVTMTTADADECSYIKLFGRRSRWKIGTALSETRDQRSATTYYHNEARGTALQWPTWNGTVAPSREGTRRCWVGELSKTSKSARSYSSSTTAPPERGFLVYVYYSYPSIIKISSVFPTKVPSTTKRTFP